MTAFKPIYFASDFHLGVPNFEKSRTREQLIVKWLEMAASNGQEIFLVGDIFDFWYEYKKVIPKGFARLQGKIAEITDAGIPVNMFTGNHDMWSFGYFEQELGVKMYREPIAREYNGKKFYIGHGDGLGPGDNAYKIIKKVFANKLCQWAFGALHPTIGIGIADFWSRSSRASNQHVDEIFQGETGEWLYIYCNEVLQKEYFDYFVFGHRHMALDLLLTNQKSRYINLGEWFKTNSFAVFDGNELRLEKGFDGK